jgi:hypothetical protein
MYVYIVALKVENPGQFWINYCKNSKQLDEMVNRIQSELKRVPNVSIKTHKLVPNAFCLAPYCEQYYRDKVLIVSPRPIDQSLVS